MKRVKYTKKQVMDAVESTRIIPVCFNPSIEVSKNILKACYDGGIRVFEFTNRGPEAVEVFSALVEYAAKELKGLILGVGSISFAKDARKFISLGSAFVVGPQYVPGVMRVCRFHGIPYMPGCGTVSEVGRSQRAGCDICKVFPGDVLGPSFVKALKAPMPWSKIMVTGGVKTTRENLEAWFKAGTFCVGIGSNLFPGDAVSNGQWDVVTDLCKNTIQIIKETI